MNVCPGCGRCRECGQPAPIVVQPYPWQPQPWINPYPNTYPTTGTPMPVTITYNTGSAL